MIANERDTDIDMHIHAMIKMVADDNPLCLVVRQQSGGSIYSTVVQRNHHNAVVVTIVEINNGHESMTAN
jgi:hypothetical protein